MALDVLIRTLFQDQGAGGGLDEVNARLRRMEFVGGPGARRGLRLAEQGMRGLAVQALGLRGPVAQVTESLLQLGGGKGAALIAAAGIGAVVTAARLATAETRALAKENERLTRSYQGVVAQGRAWVATQTAIFAADEEVNKARERHMKLILRTMPGPTGLPMDPRGLMVSPGDLEAARRNVTIAERTAAALRARRDEERRELQDRKVDQGTAFARRFVENIEGLTAQDRLTILRRERAGMEALGHDAGRVWAEAWLKAVEESIETGPGLRESLAFTRGLRGANRPQIGGGFIGLGLPGAANFRDIGFRQSIESSMADFDADRSARQREFGADILGRLQTPLERFQERIRLLDAAIAAGQFPAERRADAERLLREEMNATADAAPRLAAAIVGVIGGASIALRGGGLGPLLGAAGSAASSGIPGLFKAAPVVGSVLTIAGGLFSLFGGRKQNVRIEGYSPEALAQLRAENAGPQRITVQIVSPTTGEILDELEYELGRRARLDRVVRIPRGASLRR